MVRRVSWIGAARRAFDTFPPEVQLQILDSLTILADGGFPPHAKPLKGMEAGVQELALRHRGDAYRAVYAVQLGRDIWVIHAFQKKSKSGIKTPDFEIQLIRQRLKRLKEMLPWTKTNRSN